MREKLFLREAIEGEGSLTASLALAKSEIQPSYWLSLNYMAAFGNHGVACGPGCGRAVGGRASLPQFGTTGDLSGQARCPKYFGMPPIKLLINMISANCKANLLPQCSLWHVCAIY